jgi:hypothetical protein
MKTLRFSLFICLSFIASNSFAQEMWNIQNDLDYYYQRVQYWNSHYQLDSAAKADASLRARLLYYTENNPATMKLGFKYLKYYDGLKIFTSNDKSFRIYQWDDESGPTGHNYITVFQYMVDNKVHSASLLPGCSSEPGSNMRYKDLYTLKTKTRVYYLATYAKKFSTDDVYEGIEVFSRNDHSINDSVQIIKSTMADTAYCNYGYELFDAKGVTTHSIYFDTKKRTIYFPVVNKEYIVSSTYTAYKFNGTFFKAVNEK